MFVDLFREPLSELCEVAIFDKLVKIGDILPAEIFKLRSCCCPDKIFQQIIIATATICPMLDLRGRKKRCRGYFC